MDLSQSFGVSPVTTYFFGKFVPVLEPLQKN